jgi:hypothetical protein
MGSEPPPGDAGPDRGRATGDVPDVDRAAATPGRLSWLKHHTVAVAVIGLVGGVLVAAINQGWLRQDQQDSSAVDSPIASDASASSSASAPSSPAEGDTSPEGQQPLTWVVEDEAISVTANYEPYIFPYAGSTFLMPVDGIAPSSWPDGLQDPEGHARAHGGVPAGIAAVQLVIRTKVDSPVIITSIVPQVVERLLTPQAGYAVKVHYGCGGEPIRAVFADFDAVPMSIKYDEGQGGELVDRMALSVTPDDPELVVVNGIAKKETVAWEILIRYDAPAGTGELVVDQRTEPFVTADVKKGTPLWDYQGSAGLSKAVLDDPYGYC